MVLVSYVLVECSGYYSRLFSGETIHSVLSHYDLINVLCALFTHPLHFNLLVIGLHGKQLYSPQSELTAIGINLVRNYSGNSQGPSECRTPLIKDICSCPTVIHYCITQGHLHLKDNFRVSSGVHCSEGPL